METQTKVKLIQANLVSFNGATTFQPWRLEDTNGKVAPVFYTNEFQWSHDFSAMETTHKLAWLNQVHRCFNGATTFQPWRHERFPKT